MTTYKELVGVVLGAILIFLLAVGALMGIVTVYENARAEQTKQRCLETGGRPVPWGNTYWCR
ncbi:Hypothetical Protein OBI_RACECAR_4 [Arthrobacter phage Racecar]|nr:hypothetical protein PBI_RACECAR_85 [Arthrobacter phage Racecar]QFG12763.1 hypothetical protein PBI_MIMI_83 [Arthrobacter phage Mimi]